MKFFLIYQDDKDLTVEFDVDAGEILVDGVKPREMIDFVLIGESLRLQDIYELLKREKDKC